MRHFAHNIGDYAAATAHLTFIEDAAYHRLLRRYYQDEKPLPANLAECQRLVGARTKEERKAVESVLREFFDLDADGHHQSRADREIEVYRAKAEAARENGTKGGRPANRKKTNPVSSPVQSEKLTTPHSPLTSSEANASGGRPPDPVKVLFDDGVALLSASGTPEKQARSLIGKWRGKHGNEATQAVLNEAADSGITEPVAWIEARLGGSDRRSREIDEAIQRGLNS